MVKLIKYCVSWKGKDICDRKMYATKKGAENLRKKFINIYGKQKSRVYKVKKVTFRI